MPTFRQPSSAAFLDFDAQPARTPYARLGARRKAASLRYRGLDTSTSRLMRAPRKESAMPFARRTSVTIAMYVAASAILVGLLCWVWSLPAIGLASTPEPRPAASSSVGPSSDPCAAIVGPVRAYCTSSTPEPAASHAARIARETRSRMRVLIPATLAVAAAVGLVMVAGRRDR